MKNKEGSFLIIFVVLLIFVAAMGIIYFFFGEKPTEGAKAITIEVVDENEEKTVYELNTDAEYLSEAMEEVEGLEFTTEDGPYGKTLESVNGTRGDYEKDGAYWATYVNGEYGQYALDSQPVEDGGEYGIVYTPAE